MKRPVSITSVESKASFSENILEDFVNGKLSEKTNRLSGKNEGIFYLKGFENILCCSAPIPVSGTIDIIANRGTRKNLNRFSIPVTSGFLVTCTREGNGNYRITWVCSMS